MNTHIWKSWVLPSIPPLLIALSPQLNAYTNGTLGTTSNGKVEINLNIENQIKIFNLKQDITLSLANIDQTTNLITSQLISFAVYQNQPGGSFTISFQSNNAGSGNDLTLKDGSASSTASPVSYKVNFYSDPAGKSAVSAVTKNNGNVTGVKGATQNLTTQNGTASIQVVIDPSKGIPVGKYSDTLTMTVTPE